MNDHVILHRAIEESPPAFDRDVGRLFVSHRPIGVHEIQIVGDGIAEAEEMLASGADEDSAMTGGVAGRRQELDPGHHLRSPLDSIDERFETIQGLGERWMDSFPLLSSDDVAGRREGRLLPSGAEATPDVIGVQVGQDHNTDLVGSYAEGFESDEELAEILATFPGSSESSRSRVDQDAAVRRLDQEARVRTADRIRVLFPLAKQKLSLLFRSAGEEKRGCGVGADAVVDGVTAKGADAELRHGCGHIDLLGRLSRGLRRSYLVGG